MKKPFLILFACCWAAGCMSGVKKPATNVVVDSTRTVITLMPDSAGSDTVDLGRMHAGEVVRKEVWLRNGGNEPMIILSSVTSCGCTTTDFERKPVQPGDRAEFAFEFDSKGFSGYQLKHITLRTTLSKRPFTLVVTGEIE